MDVFQLVGGNEMNQYITGAAVRELREQRKMTHRNEENWKKQQICCLGSV